MILQIIEQDGNHKKNVELSPLYDKNCIVRYLANYVWLNCS
jgi:hypothetical protein